MLLAIALSVSASLAGLDDQADLNAVDAICMAYQANRASITRATIRARYSVGDAPDLAAARDGRWTDRSDADCLFALDGDRARFDKLFPIEDLRAKRARTGPFSYTSRLSWLRMVTDGRVTLADRQIVSAVEGGPLRRQVRIDPGTSPFYGAAQLPLHLGRKEDRPYFGRLPEMLRSGATDLRLKEVTLGSRLDGREVAEIAVGGKTSTKRFWVDLRRGAIPILTRSEMNGGRIVEFDRYEDLRQLANGAWFPFRRIIFSTIGNTATEWTIQEADFDEAPDPDLFRLKLPKAEPVVDSAAMRSYPPSDMWDLAHLPAANARGVETLRPRGPSVEPPEMPGERQPRPYASIAFIAVGVILVGLALALALSRRRSRA